MHLLYFRFWHRVMRELGLVFEDEPCKRLVTQGIVNGPDGRKMSKRWGNVVTPGPIVDRFGADTMRMFMLFASPPEKDIDWSDEQVEGLFRFLSRVWRIFYARQGHLRGARDGLSPAPPARSWSCDERPIGPSSASARAWRPSSSSTPPSPRSWSS